MKRNQHILNTLASDFPTHYLDYERHRWVFFTVDDTQCFDLWEPNNLYHLEVRKSTVPGAGLGVFLAGPKGGSLPPKSYLETYRGELMDLEAFNQDPSNYAISVSTTEVLDARNVQTTSSVAHLFNTRWSLQRFLSGDKQKTNCAKATVHKWTYAKVVGGVTNYAGLRRDPCAQVRITTKKTIRVEDELFLAYGSGMTNLLKYHLVCSYIEKNKIETKERILTLEERALSAIQVDQLDDSKESKQKRKQRAQRAYKYMRYVWKKTKPAKKKEGKADEEEGEKQESSDEESFDEEDSESSSDEACESACESIDSSSDD